MIALGWLALAGAILLIPAPSAALVRVRALAAGGRFAAAVPGMNVPRGTARSRWRRLVTWASVPRLLVLVGAVAVAAVAAEGSVALALAAAGLIVAAGGCVRAASRRRRESDRESSLLSAVRLIVAELEAGSTIAHALTAAADGAGADAGLFASAAARARRGESVDHLFTSADPRLAPIGHAWRLARGSGAPLSDVLARIANDLAARQQQRRAVALALAGPRSSGVMLAGLPLVGIVLGMAMGAAPLVFLFTDHTGQLVCCIGVLLDAGGLGWTQHLLGRAER